MNSNFLNKLKDKQFSNKSINAAALIKRRGFVLMGLREYKKGRPVWTFPGGRNQSGESLETTLKREVEEETGISDLKIIDFIGKKKGVKDGDIVYFFHCKTEQEPKVMEPEKFLEWRWVSLNTLPQNLIDPRDVVYIKLLMKEKGKK